MTHSRMQLFNLVALAVAHELEQGFPTVHGLEFKDLRLLRGLDAETSAACDQIFFQSVEWLRSQGFVDYDSTFLPAGFALISLTEKGCARMLMTIPAVSGQPESTVRGALQAVSHGGFAAVTEQVIVAISRTFLGAS